VLDDAMNQYFEVDTPAIGTCGGSETAGYFVYLNDEGKIDPCFLVSGSPAEVILLQTNGVDNPLQNILNLIAGSNITLVADNFGGVTISASENTCAAYLCTPAGNCPVEIDLSAPTHPGQLLISQPGNCTAIWADPQVQGLYPAGSPICPAPAYVAPTCIQPIGIGIQDPNGELQWLQGSYSGSPTTFALDVNVVNPLTVTFSESSICVTQCTTPWVVTDTAAEAFLATIASVITVAGSPAVPVFNVNVTTGTVAVTEVYNAIPPTPTSGSSLPLQADSAGSLYTDNTGRIPTYRASQSAFVPLANAIIPFFTIQGSATKIIRVRQIKISWACTTGNSAANVIRFRRFSAISGGVVANVVPTPDDTLNPAVTAVISQYTTLPTVATPFNLGVMNSEYMQWTTNTSSLVGPGGIQWDFGVNGVQAATLRGISDWFGIEVAAVAAAGSLMTIKVVWTEE
jgi:hypothetical protein